MNGGTLRGPRTRQRPLLRSMLPCRAIIAVLTRRRCRGGPPGSDLRVRHVHHLPAVLEQGVHGALVVPHQEPHVPVQPGVNGVMLDVVDEVPGGGERGPDQREAAGEGQHPAREAVRHHDVMPAHHLQREEALEERRVEDPRMLVGGQGAELRVQEKKGNVRSST